MRALKSGEPLQKWALAHEPEKTSPDFERYWNQIMFVRDVVPGILAQNAGERLMIEHGIRVIATHTSGLVLLPIFRIELENGGTFTMRCDFHSWIVSFDAPYYVEADFTNLFDTRARVIATSCDGFPKDCIYGSFAENPGQFTITLLGDTHYLFTFFWIFTQKMLH
jgi:hypothetical protein